VCKIGDIKWHHEAGRIFEVEIIDVQQKKSSRGGNEGTEYTLKGTGESKTSVGDELKKGKILSVWRTNEKNMMAYVGWHLLDY
jgi:hypothetical protein